jgi:hypothetical protein
MKAGELEQSTKGSHGKVKLSYDVHQKIEKEN